MTTLQRISIHTDHIQLDALLKLAHVADTGGQAKWIVKDGKVRVNGTIEVRRGRKVHPGEMVDIEGCQTLLVVREGG